MLAIMLSLLLAGELEFVQPTVTTFAGVTDFELKTDLHKIDILGLEIRINGEPAHYFELPPFETSIDLSSYPEGPITIEAVLEHFTEGPPIRRVIKGTNFPNYYEEEVRLIRVPVSVELEGDPNINATDFVLKEDGKPQAIDLLLTEQQPLDLIFLLDTSSSMERKMPFVVRAAQQMIDTLKKEDRITVIGFNEQVYEVMRATTDKKRVKLRLTSLESNGGTNIWGAVFAGTKILARSPMRRAIVLFTDGQHSDEGVDKDQRKTLEDSMNLALSNGVPVYAMGVSTGKTQAELVQLAAASGGRYFPMRNNRSIREAFLLIGEQLSRQYLLCYNTHTKKSGSYNIVVDLPNHPKATLIYPKSIQIER